MARDRATNEDDDDDAGAPAAAVRHFARMAPDYNRLSGRFPWSWIKRREAAAVFGLLGPVAGLEALDLGCGAGYYTSGLIERGARSVVAVDASAAMLAELPAEGVRPILADAMELALDAVADVAVSAGLLEFVADPAIVLARAYRAVRPGGRLVVLAPSSGAFARLYRRYHAGHGLGIRLFDQGALAAAAEPAGWRPVARRTVPPLALVAAFARPG